MKNIIISLTLVILLIGIIPHQILASPNAKSEENVKQIKETIRQLNQKKSPKLKVTTTEGKILKGTLLEVNENALVISLEKNAETVSVPYPQVKKIQGGKAQWIVPLALLAAGLIVAIVVVKQTK